MTARHIDRDQLGIKCDCGGYAEQVDCTEEELKLYNCNKAYACCARAFVCCICKKRIAGRADAPEYDDYRD